MKKKVFTYQLSDFLSYEFLRFIDDVVIINYEDFNCNDYITDDFSDELTEAIEAELEKPIQLIDTEIINSIAKSIYFDAYCNALYNGFHKWLGKNFMCKFRRIIKAGKELVSCDYADRYDIHTYTFTIDFEKLTEEKKKEYFLTYEDINRADLFSFLNYNIELFENYIIAMFDADNVIDAETLEIELENRLYNLTPYLHECR